MRGVCEREMFEFRRALRRARRVVSMSEDDGAGGIVLGISLD